MFYREYLTEWLRLGFGLPQKKEYYFLLYQSHSKHKILSLFFFVQGNKLNILSPFPLYVPPAKIFRTFPYLDIISHNPADYILLVGWPSVNLWMSCGTLFTSPHKGFIIFLFMFISSFPYLFLLLYYAFGPSVGKGWQ